MERKELDELEQFERNVDTKIDALTKVVNASLDAFSKALSDGINHIEKLIGEQNQHNALEHKTIREEMRAEHARLQKNDREQYGMIHGLENKMGEGITAARDSIAKEVVESESRTNTKIEGMETRVDNLELAPGKKALENNQTLRNGVLIGILGGAGAAGLIWLVVTLAQSGG